MLVYKLALSETRTVIRVRICKAFAILIALLTVIAAFLPQQTYAVTGTFGETTVGPSDTGYGGYIYSSGLPYEVSGTITITSITCYFTTNANARVAVYDDSGGKPNNLIVQSASESVLANEWHEFSVMGTQTSVGKYHLAVQVEGSGPALKYADTYPNIYTNFAASSYGSFPASFGTPAGSATWTISIFATYMVGAYDIQAPTYSNVGTSTAVAGRSSKFYAQWNDNVGLSGFIFGTNNTGTWQNGTWTPLAGTSAWSNVTKTLTSTIGTRVEYRFWCNDTSNNWADTGVRYVTTTPEPTEIFSPVKAVVIISDFSYLRVMGETYNMYYGDAIVFGILQEAGIPYDIKFANEMADVEKLKQYCLIVLPHYLASYLPENLTNAVLAAGKDGVGVWTVQFPGESTETGQIRYPRFISQLNNVAPVLAGNMIPKLAVNDTYLISKYYSKGNVVGVGPMGIQALTTGGVYNGSRSYHEVVSVYNGTTYKGGSIVASTLGNGRTVWCISDPTVWQAQGILIRLIRWAAKSPVFLESTDSPNTGVNLQLRIDGDAIKLYPTEYQQFMSKVGSLSSARVSLYITTDDFDAQCYAIAKQYPKNEYGSNSSHHEYLPGLSPEALNDELNGSKALIEANLGREITGFAYPFNAYNKITTAGAGAYNYVYVGSELNLSLAYPSRVWLPTSPDPQTTGLNTYSLFLTASNDYELFWNQHKTASEVLNIWKSHFNYYKKQATVSESNVGMNLLWHVKEMSPSALGTTPYFSFLDWVVSNKGRFVTAQELVQSTKEIETANLKYKKTGNTLNVTLDGSLSKGHPLRLFNSTQTIRSVTIDGQRYTNFRSNVVVLPALGPGVHRIIIRFY